LGEQHFTAGPLQQHHAQLIFQLTNLPAKRRLANVAGVCRTPKMAVFSQCHQVLKITNIHYPSSIATIVHGDSKNSNERLSLSSILTDNCSQERSGTSFNP